MEKQLTEDIYLASAGAKIEQGKRTTIALKALLIVTIVALGCGVLYYSGPQPQLVRLASFLLLGLVLATTFQRWTTIPGNNFPVFFVIAVCIQLVVAAFSFVTKKFGVFANLSYVAAFLLPLVIIQAWRVFLSIPRVEPSPWFYSGDLQAKPRLVYLENTQFRIKVKTPGGKSFKISSAAAAQSKLGTAFCYIAKEQNDAGWKRIAFTDESGQPRGWLFYTLSFGFRKKYLDPEESLYDNNIRSNATIIAECVR